MLMKTILLLTLLYVIVPTTPAQTVPPKQDVQVTEDVFISADHPKIVVRPDQKMKYLGKFPFDIRGIAGGYRYIWGEIDHGKHLKRTFIIQMEGYYPSNDYVYEYGAENPAKLGSHDYQHNVWIYDNDESIRERPGNESDLT